MKLNELESYIREQHNKGISFPVIFYELVCYIKTIIYEIEIEEL